MNPITLVSVNKYEVGTVDVGRRQGSTPVSYSNPKVPTPLIP